MDTHNAIHAKGAALLAMATFTMVGCADDDMTEPSLNDIAPTSNEVSGFCQEYMTADSAVGLALAGSGEPQTARDAFTVAVASAPEDISVAVETLAS